MTNQSGMISASFARRVAAVVRRVERDGGGPKNAAGMGPPLRREEGSSEVSFKITAHTQDGSNKRWSYTARKWVKSSAEYGGWVAAADVADYTLFNSIEVINGASGLWGNGVNSTNLPASPATMTLQPVPNGVIVRAWAETFTPSGGAATTEWWFSYENGVDGSCT